MRHWASAKRRDWALGEREAEGLGIGHRALGGAKRRDWALGEREAEGLGIGHTSPRLRIAIYQDG
ncbi:hypothetical protein IQ269_11940 [Tychonema sp. LEGE 07199]|uniref:hypothetical protein n=1 Tax=unclassified Tychonema TaxID=2642144 RepID=UPI00187E70C0|nr:MULTISPECIES: hypothetical protein [unclassified Tychonema]MBE9121488.1 hypothetical protein [Tychonema sp. LEGE 07199]MBE9130345.1 hypothetical protein [Tychonema sp. LEGE 07196]